MASFGLESKNDEAVAKIMEVRRNLLVENLIKNPFNGKITAHGKDFFTVIMDPVYPRFYLLGWFPAIIGLLFMGTWYGNALLVVAAIMLCCSILWSSVFYYLLFYLVTKRGVRYVSAQEALKRVV